MKKSIAHLFTIIILANLLFGLFGLVGVSASATTIKILPTRQKDFLGGDQAASTRVLQLVARQLNPNQYSEVRAQLMRDVAGRPHHILLYLSRIGFHQIKIVSLNLDANFNVQSINQNYKMQLGDLAEQPGRGLEVPPHCPDPSIQFVSFAPNDMDLEQQIATEVGAFAAAHGFKTLMLLKEKATRQNYLDVMSCPNLKGNFYDGDANPSAFVTVDGVITSDEMTHFFSGAMKYQVTNIWLACEAFNDPLKSVMIEGVQAQKFAAGINDLLVGPSDRTAMCAMKAAITGLPMTQAFQDCYKQLDTPADQWGFSGKGSEYFAKSMQ